MEENFMHLPIFLILTLLNSKKIKPGAKTIGLKDDSTSMIAEVEKEVRLQQNKNKPTSSESPSSIELIEVDNLNNLYFIKFGTGGFMCAHGFTTSITTCKKSTGKHTRWKLKMGRGKRIAILSDDGKCLRPSFYDNKRERQGFRLKISKCHDIIDYRWKINRLLFSDQGSSSSEDDEKKSPPFEDEKLPENSSEFDESKVNGFQLSTKGVYGQKRQDMTNEKRVKMKNLSAEKMLSNIKFRNEEKDNSKIMKNHQIENRKNEDESIILYGDNDKFENPNPLKKDFIIKKDNFNSQKIELKDDSTQKLDPKMQQITAIKHKVTPITIPVKVKYAHPPHSQPVIYYDSLKNMYFQQIPSPDSVTVPATAFVPMELRTISQYQTPTI